MTAESDLLRQAADYGTELRRSDTLGHKTRMLSALGPRNAINPAGDDRLFGEICARIERRQPLSIIRLGDGEGNILFWGLRREAFPTLAQHGMAAISGMMFGRAGDAQSYARLYADMSLAVRNADYLGIPLPDQDAHAVSLMCGEEADTVGPRGNMGQAAVWDWLRHMIEDRLARGPVVIVNAFFHTSLVGYVEQVLASAGNLSLVTCYPELLGRFVKRFAVSPGETFLIPPQASNEGKSSSSAHFPDRFDAIRNDLARQNLSGRFFLVGAGVLGKAYCDIVRRQGGMAIDAGSMMDVWMGRGVRAYQTAEFVAAYAIGQPSC